MSDTTAKDALPPQYAELMQTLEDFARLQVKESEQIPVTAMLLRDGEVVQVMAGILTDAKASKYFAEAVRQAASKEKADAVAVISEVWMLRAIGTRAEVERIRAQSERVHDHPDRIDGLSITLETRDGDWLGSAEIEPGRNVKALEWRKADASGGRLSRLLPVQYPTPAEVDAAAATVRALLVERGLDPDHIHPSGQTVMEQMTEQLRQAPARSVNDRKRLETMADKLAAGFKVIFNSGAHGADSPLIPKLAAALKKHGMAVDDTTLAKVAAMVTIFRADFTDKEIDALCAGFADRARAAGNKP